MYKLLFIEYSNPSNVEDSITLQYNIRSTAIAQRWAEKVNQAIINNYIIDDPKRFYGFNDIETEKKLAIESINNCIDIINNYSPNFVTKRVYGHIEQDTLNYLHHIFEVYHGLLDKPHEFYVNAPDIVKNALSKLNIDVHRCELFLNQTGRKISPRHIVTCFSMPRHNVLEDEDYKHFTDFFEFGTVYLLYVEIGKTLEDLSKDNDAYISEEAYKPFRHYTMDFEVKFFTTSTETWKANRLRMSKYYQEHKDFFISKQLPISHPYNLPGSIPVADLVRTNINVMEELKTRQMVTKLALI